MWVFCCLFAYKNQSNLMMINLLKMPSFQVWVVQSKSESICLVYKNEICEKNSGEALTFLFALMTNSIHSSGDWFFSSSFHLVICMRQKKMSAKFLFVFFFRIACVLKLVRVLTRKSKLVHQFASVSIHLAVFFPPLIFCNLEKAKCLMARLPKYPSSKRESQKPLL